MERPIVLSAPKGEVREMVERAGVGLAVDAEDPAQLADAIELLRREPERARQLAARARSWAERGFRREVLARRMAEFLAERVAEAAGTRAERAA
jgi:glycosyltransferase involved in cell wall biosynthesis